MRISKNGIISSNEIDETQGMNILSGPYKTSSDPYIITGKDVDMFYVTSNVSRVIPGKTYYYVAKCSPTWSAAHAGGSGSYGKCTIWLYFSKTYDASNYDYDTPICYNSSNWIREGVWKVTVPADMNMVRVRVNTYSDGTNSVTAKFWDITLIPEEYFVGNGSSTKIFTDKCISKEIVEG